MEAAVEVAALCFVFQLAMSLVHTTHTILSLDATSAKSTVTSPESALTRVLPLEAVETADRTKMMVMNQASSKRKRWRKPITFLEMAKLMSR